MPDATAGSAMDDWVLLGRLRAPLVQRDRSRFRLKISLLCTCERIVTPDSPGSPDVTASRIASRVVIAGAYGVIRRLKNFGQIARRLLNDRSRPLVPRLACPAVPGRPPRGGASRPRGMGAVIAALFLFPCHPFPCQSSTYVLVGVNTRRTEEWQGNGWQGNRRAGMGTNKRRNLSQVSSPHPLWHPRRAVPGRYRAGPLNPPAPAHPSPYDSPPRRLAPSEPPPRADAPPSPCGCGSEGGPWRSSSRSRVRCAG